MTLWPAVLTIAGSDSGGGAGVQADLKTFQALGCYGASVITAVTAQNTQVMELGYPLPMEVVAAQFSAVWSDMHFAAVKCGMLGTAKVVEFVASQCARFKPANLVVDPVLTSTVGGELLERSAISILREGLFPHASVVTPNIPEVEQLIGFLPRDAAETERAARELGRFGPEWVVVKGGHAEECEEVADCVFCAASGEIIWLRSPRVVTRNTHGTGCTFASAIAAYLALGEETLNAIRLAREYLQGALMRGAGAKHGKGNGPLRH